MKKILFLFVASAVCLLIAWRLWVYTGKDFLSGNEISLIDRFDKAYVIRSHFPISLQSVSNAEIKAQWKKITTLNRAALWYTKTDYFIAGTSNHRRLQCNGKNIEFEGNFFQSEIPPGKWSSYENQLLLTTETNADPNRIHCVLDYETYRSEKAPLSMHEDLKSAIQAGSEAYFLPLKYPMSSGTLKRNQQTVPASEWEYMKPPPQVLFQVNVRGVYRLFSSADVLRKDAYLRGGLGQLRVIASGDLAGSEMPRVGVSMDHRKVGSFQLRTAQKSEYATFFPVLNGQHLLELTFENDFFDPKTNADRNVGIHRVEIEYEPAILIQKTVTKDAHYTIDYQPSYFQLQEFYANFQSDEKNSQISTGTGIAEEMRRSFLFAAGDEIEFPIIVPRSASLEFGYSFQSRGKTDARLQVTLNRAWGLPITLFDQGLENGKDWSNARIELARYAGERICLNIRNTGNEQSVPALLFFSNPRIVSSGQKPQLVLMFSFDALRADHLSSYGYERKTSPNIDALARDGVLFENAYSAATWTLKSFGSTFTSLYPSFNNLRDVDQSLKSTLTTFPQLLQRHGYSTAGFIDNPYLHPIYGFGRGFDSYNFQISGVEDRVRSALDWLERSRAEKRFLFVHVINPHSPYTPPAKYVRQLSPDGNTNQSFYPRLVNRVCQQVDPSDLKQAILQYDGEIRQIDDLFQALIDKIKAQGIYDDAMIIVMSDHGEEFLDHNSLWHGSNVFTSTSHVPLIIKFPARFRVNGVRVHRHVHLIDLFPTVLEVAGIHESTDARGQSLLARKSPDRVLFTEGRGDTLGIMNDRYHYMYAYNKALGFDCSPQNNEQLYDLQTDPRELHDLSVERPDLITFFREQKQKYENGAAEFRKANDLHNGPVVVPDEAMKEQLRALGYIH